MRKGVGGSGDGGRTSARRSDPATQATEGRLIAAARRGDRAALEALFKRVAASAYRFSRGFCRDPHDAEDLAQDVMATLVRTLPTFRGDASLTTWTHVVARRACARRRRRESRQRPFDSLTREQLHRPDPSGEPDRALDRNRLAVALERAIRELPDSQREVLVMRDVEGLPAAEVGRVLGLGERAVKSRLHRARLALREQLAPFVGGAAARAPGCPDTPRMLSRHLEGELSADDCARMEAHVASCRACGEACRALRRALGACRAFGGRPLPREIGAAVRAAAKRLIASS